MRWGLGGNTPVERCPCRQPWCTFRPSVARILLCTCILGAAGCGAERMTPVSGNVTLDDEPLKGGGVTFFSDQHEHIPAGVIAAGKYEIFTNGKKGAPPGAYRVIVIADDFSVDQYPEKKSATASLPKSLVALKYADKEKTPLRVTVTEQPAADAYDLKVTKQ